MKKKIYLALIIIITAITAKAQYQWSSALNTNSSGQAANPLGNPIQPYGEKSIVKSDAVGAVYSLARTYSVGLGGYYPLLTKQNAAGTIQWIADPGFNPGGNNFYVVDLDINPVTGATYCLLGRLDNSYFRVVSYDASGNFLFTYDGYPYYKTPNVFTNWANDLVYYNNHLYVLETVPRGGPVTSKVTDINVPALTVSLMDTVNNHNSAIGFNIDASPSGVYAAGYGAAGYKWFTTVTRYNFSGVVKYNIRTDVLLPARGGKNELPMQMKCNTANGLPYIIGYTTDTSGLSANPVKSKVFIMKPMNNITGATFKFKEYDITNGKTSLPYSMEFNPNGYVFVAGLTAKKGFAMYLDPITLAALWTTKVGAPDSLIFTATAGSGDKLVAVGQQYNAANNTLQTAAVRFNLDGTYGGIVYGNIVLPDNRYEINTAVFDNYATGTKINCAGRFSFTSPQNGAYTTQFSIVGFPVFASASKNEISVEPSKNAIAENIKLQAYPNPATSNINIQLTVQKTGNYSIRITNMAGAIMENKQLNLATGKQLISFDCTNYAAGLYFILIDNALTRQTLSFTKAK